jgi:hypothetical protein
VLLVQASLRLAQALPPGGRVGELRRQLIAAALAEALVLLASTRAASSRISLASSE